MLGAVYTEGDWTYIVEEERSDDNIKNRHELYYKGENVTDKVRWFANISPYSIATREQFDEAINELKLQFWLTDGKRDAII